MAAKTKLLSIYNVASCPLADFRQVSLLCIVGECVVALADNARSIVTKQFKCLQQSQDKSAIPEADDYMKDYSDQEKLGTL